MDYHSLPRKQLQALCKKHDIPANLTNLQMADSLAALLNVEAAKGGKKQSAPVRDNEEKPVLTEISNVPKVSTRSKKVGKAIEEEKVEEPPQSTDSEDDGGAKTGKKGSRGRTKVGLKTGKGDEVVEEVVKTRRGVSREKASVFSAPEVNVEAEEQKVGNNNNKKKKALVNEVVKEKVEEAVEIEQGVQKDLALQNGRRNTRNPRKKAEENGEAEATPPCKKTVRTRTGKVTHEVDSRSVAARKSSVRVSDGDKENMTKTTELGSVNGNKKMGRSPIIIDLVDDSDEEEEESKEKKGDPSVVSPAEKAAAAEHKKEGEKVMPVQRTLRGRQANASVVENNAKPSESSKDMVTRRVQKGGKNELVGEACVEESKSIEVDASIEATLNPSQSPKHVATRRGRRGAQKEEEPVNACTNRKVNVADVSAENPSDPVGASLETTTNLSLSPKQIVTRRSQKVGQKKGVAVSASVEEDKIDVVNVSVEATANPVDASLEATADLSQSPKQVVTRRSRKAGQKKEVATSTTAEEDKVNVVNISAKATSADQIEASLEATTNLPQSPKQIVTRRSRKAGQTEELAVSATAEESGVNAANVSVEATADPSESLDQVFTRRGRRGGQKNDENKNGAANPVQSSKPVVRCRGKKELMVNASAEEDRVSAADVSGSLKQEVGCRGRKGAKKDELVVTKNEAANSEAIAANPFQSPKQVFTRRGRKGGQNEEDKVNTAHVSTEATTNCADLPKQVVTRRGKGGQKVELMVAKMVEEGNSKVANVPVEVVTCKGQNEGQKELEVDFSVEQDKTYPVGEDVKDCSEDHEAVEPDGMERMAHRKNSERKIHGPKIETRRTCRKQGAPENEVHKKANIDKTSDEKQRQSGSDNNAKETTLTQELQRKVGVSKPRKICGDQEGADIEYPAQEKLNVKESHQKATSSRRTAIRRDIKKPSMRGSQSTIKGTDQKVVAEKECKGLAHEDKKIVHLDESGALGVIPKEENAPVVDTEAAEMSRETVIIQTLPSQCDKYENKPERPAEDTASVQDGSHMDERTNIEDEEEADAAITEKLVSVPMDEETIFKESAVGIEEMKIHDEEQQIIKLVAATDTTVMKDAIHMDDGINMQDEKGADAATSEKLGSVPMDSEANLKESTIEIEETKIHDEEQEAPTDECRYESEFGYQKYVEKDSEPELTEGYKPKSIEGGNYTKQHQSVIEVPSIIQVEDRLDSSSLTQQTENVETQQSEILSQVKFSGAEKKSSIGFEEGSPVKESLKNLLAESGLGALEVHDPEAHLQAADIASLNAENMEVQESEFLVHVEHTKQENPVDVSHRGHVVEESFEVLQADSQFIYNQEIQEKGFPGREDEMTKRDQFREKSENMHSSLSCTDETDEIIESKDSVAGESLTDTDVDSLDDSLSECYESDSHQVYVGHAIFPDASRLQEEDKEDTDYEDESDEETADEDDSDEEKIADSIAETDDEDESHDLDIAEETADGDKTVDSIAETDDEGESDEETTGEDESDEETADEDELDEEIADEVKIADSIAETDNEGESDDETADEDESDEETADEENIADDGDESHDFNIAKETADEEKIADSIAGNWNERDRSELLREKQDLEILPQQASSSEVRDREECTIQYISATSVQENPISLVNNSEAIERYQDHVVEKEEQIEQVSKSETHDDEERISHKNYNSSQNDGCPMSDAVSLKVGDHQLIHSSYDEPQEAYENIRVSDVGLQPHNSAIEDEVHEDKFHYSDNDKQFYGLDELDSVCSVSEPMPSVSQHAGESSDYKVDGIHVHTEIESDISKEQLSCPCNYKETEPDTAEEIVDSSNSFEGSIDVFTSLGMDESVFEKEVTVEETVHTKINSEDSTDLFPCSGMTDSILETEADISIDFVDCNNVFPHQGMDDSVLDKCLESLTKEACKQEMPQLNTPLKTPEVIDGYNISPCLVTLFGLEYSTASKKPEFGHCNVEEKIPVSNVDLANSPLLGDIDNEDESHDLDIAEETADEEQIADSVGGKQKGNLLVEDQVDENQSVDSGSSLQNDNVLFEHEANKGESNEFPKYQECATMKNVFVSNGILIVKSCQAQSMGFSSNQGFEGLELNLDAGNWNEGDQFELVPQKQVLEGPVQQTSNSEAQADEECSKEYLQQNPISLVNDEGLEDELTDSKTTEGYQVSVVEKEEQSEQFSKSETQNAQETVSPKNYNDEAQEAVKDEAHEIKSYFSDKSKVCFGLDELNGPQKEEDDSQQDYENKAYEGESMDCGNTPELKNKLQFDADNLNGVHQFEHLPKALSLENQSQLASYSEDHEPGECSEEELLVLNDVQQSHISLVNGEAQEDKLSDPKTSEGFHDSVYQREEHYELASMAETQDVEETIFHKQNDGSPDAVWMKVQNPEQVDMSNELNGTYENIQASEFCLQYCNSATKDEVHQDNFSDNGNEFYNLNELYGSTPQKEEDVVEQITKNGQIPLTDSDQVEHGSCNVAVEKNEVEDGAYQESISTVDGITDASPIKEKLFDMDNHGKHEGFIAPDKIEGNKDDQEEQSMQNEAEETQKFKVGENIQLVKVDTVASNQEPSNMDTPLKMPMLTKGLDISPCLNSLFGLDFSDPLDKPKLMESNDALFCSGIDDSLPENISEIVTEAACKQELYQLDNPLKTPEVTEVYNIAVEKNEVEDGACQERIREQLFAMDNNGKHEGFIAPAKIEGNNGQEAGENIQIVVSKQEPSQLDTPLKNLEVTEGYNISPCLSTLFGLDSSIPSKSSELRKSYNISPCLSMNESLLEDKDVCQRELACNQQLSLDKPLKRLEHAEGPEYDTPVKKLELIEKAVTTETEYLSPHVPLGDHVSVMEKDATVLEGTEHSESILLTENPVESGEVVAEGSTILADMNVPSRGDSKSTKLVDRILTLSNRLQTLQLDLQGQLPESFYATPSRRPMNSKRNGTTEKTRDTISVYRPRQSIGSDEAMHSSFKESPAELVGQLSLWKLQNLHKENETAAKDSEKEMSKQFVSENLSSPALDQRMESLDTPLKMLEHTEGHDISPCLYTLFGPECSKPLTNRELTEVTGTPFENALQPPLVTESGSPGASLGHHVSLMDTDVRVFEETEQSQLMQLTMQEQLPELCYVTPSRKPMNSEGTGSEKTTRDAVSGNPRQSVESDKAIRSSMKENTTDLAQLSLRNLRNLYKESETKAKDSEKVMSKLSTLQSLSSNALEQRLESLDTPLKTLEHTEGHDISPCLYTLFGPEYNTPLEKPELKENNDMSPCLQVLFGEEYGDVTGTSFEDALQQPLVNEPEVSLGYNVPLVDKDASVVEGTEQSKCTQLDLQGQLPAQQPSVPGPEPPEVQFGYQSLMDKNVSVSEETEQSKRMQLDLQGQLQELSYVTPSRKQMTSKGIGSARKTRDPMSVNRPRPSSSMKENPNDLAQLSLRQLRNLYKEKETKAKDSEKVLSKRPALQNLSSNALEQRLESVGYSPRPFPSERRFQILEEDCS